MSTKAKMLGYIFSIVIIIVTLVAFTSKRINWNYEYSFINGYGTLVFYDSDVVFIFSEKHAPVVATGHVVHSGFFPIAGKRFSGNRLEYYSKTNGCHSSFKFSFSPFTEKGTWRINGHTIELSDSGKTIVLDNQKIDWKKDSMTVVIVNANNIHESKSILKKEVFSTEINTGCSCPSTIPPSQNTTSNVEPMPCCLPTCGTYTLLSVSYLDEHIRLSINLVQKSQDSHKNRV